MKPLIRIAFFALWGNTALGQAPDAGTPEPSLRPFDPEELATPPPEWRTPPQPSPEPQLPAKPAPASDPTPNSYAWNFFFVDPLAMAAMAYGIYWRHEDAIVWGMTAYLLNGPLIHMLLHHRFDLAGASLLNRVGAPVAMLVTLGNVVGAFKCETASCTRNQTVGLFAAGMLAAWAWDILAAGSPDAPPPLELSAVFGTTDRGTPTAGFGLRF